MRDLHLIPRISRALRSASYVGLVLLCAAVLTVGAVFYLWQRYQFVSLGYEVNRLRAAKTRLREVIEPLEVEAAYLSRLERIDALARKEQGMRPPRPAQVILLEDNVPPVPEAR